MLIKTAFLTSILLIGFSQSVFAKDSTELYEYWRKSLESTSFYCASGRAPMADSGDGWAVRAYPGCTFAGPLDTKINRLKLEAPILNPLLTMDSLKAALQQLNLPIQSEGGSSLSFRLPNGVSLTASMIDSKQMQDPLFHLGAINTNWGTRFISITARQTGDLDNFISLAHSLSPNTVFWTNAHFAEEQKVWPRFQAPRTYTPVPLLSKCGNGDEWKNFGAGGERSLLLVGDTHDLPETLFFREVLKTRKFAWAGIEMPADQNPILQSFLDAKTPAEENPPLAKLTERFPKSIIAAFQDNLRLLKSSGVKIVFIDSDNNYFNFPFTNVAFHGMVLGTRNYVWARNLPSDWTGAAVLLGGFAHFLEIPAAGFQDFARERFPGLEMGLIYPLEKCSP